MAQGGRVKLDPSLADVMLLPWTYPWWKRVLCYLVWKNRPFKWVAGLLWSSPYRKVVVVARSEAVARYVMGQMREEGKDDNAVAG